MFAATYVQEQRMAGASLKQIAVQLDMNYNTLRRLASQHGLTRQNLFKDPPIRIPAARPCFTDRPLTLPSVNCLAIGDLHVPHHNRQMLERAIYVTQRYHPNVRAVVIGGDIFDFASLSDYPHNGPEPDPGATLRLAGDVLRAICQHFDQCLIVSGNHDERLSKRLDKAWDMQLLINAALGRNWPCCDIQVSNLDYLYVGDTWLIGHPSHYSGQGGKTPSELADVYQRNVITFHNHVVGLSQSKTGKYLGIDAGHMTQPDQHYYQYRRLTKYARWSSGFCVLSNGFPYVYMDHWVDWESLGC